MDFLQTEPRDAGVATHQHKQAINTANVPQAEFDRLVEGDKPPTISQLAIKSHCPRVAPAQNAI